MTAPRWPRVQPSCPRQWASHLTSGTVRAHVTECWPEICAWARLCPGALEARLTSDERCRSRSKDIARPAVGHASHSSIARVRAHVHGARAYRAVRELSERTRTRAHTGAVTLLLAALSVEMPFVAPNCAQVDAFREAELLRNLSVNFCKPPRSTYCSISESHAVEDPTELKAHRCVGPVGIHKVCHQ